MPTLVKRDHSRRHLKVSFFPTEWWRYAHSNSSTRVGKPRLKVRVTTQEVRGGDPAMPAASQDLGLAGEPLLLQVGGLAVDRCLRTPARRDRQSLHRVSAWCVSNWRELTLENFFEGPIAYKLWEFCVVVIACGQRIMASCDDWRKYFGKNSAPTASFTQQHE